MWEYFLIDTLYCKEYTIPTCSMCKSISGLEEFTCVVIFTLCWKHFPRCMLFTQMVTQSWNLETGSTPESKPSVEEKKRESSRVGSVDGDDYLPRVGKTR